MQECESESVHHAIQPLWRVDLATPHGRGVEVHPTDEIVRIPNTFEAIQPIQLLLQLDADCFADSIL